MQVKQGQSQVHNAQLCQLWYVNHSSWETKNLSWFFGCLVCFCILRSSWSKQTWYNTVACAHFMWGSCMLLWFTVYGTHTSTAVFWKGSLTTTENDTPNLNGWLHVQMKDSKGGPSEQQPSRPCYGNPRNCKWKVCDGFNVHWQLVCDITVSQHDFIVVTKAQFLLMWCANWLKTRRVCMEPWIESVELLWEALLSWQSETIQSGKARVEHRLAGLGRSRTFVLLFLLLKPLLVRNHSYALSLM